MAGKPMAPTLFVASLSCWVFVAVLLLLHREARSSVSFIFSSRGRVLWVRGELRAEPDDHNSVDESRGQLEDEDDYRRGPSEKDGEEQLLTVEDRQQETTVSRKHRPKWEQRVNWHHLFASGAASRMSNHFNFTFHQPVPEQVKQVFIFGGQVVSTYFENVRVPMRVLVEWMPLERDVLAQAGPTAFYKVKSERHGFVWLPKALMNQRVAFPPVDYDQPDMVLSVNSLGSWHLGLDGAVPRGKYDLLTVIIHELQHGLGFLSMIGQGNLLNGLQKFPEAVEGEAYVFDRYVHIAEQGHIFSVSTDYQTIDRDVGLVWDSPSFTPENRPKLFMPDRFDGTSSISHLDEAAYPPGAPSSLMTPILSKQEAIHNLGGLVIKMYEDMGWLMRDCTQYTSCGSCVSKLCRWCYDADTGVGECGDPTSHPFFNWECGRANSTDAINEFCPLNDELRPPSTDDGQAAQQQHRNDSHVSDQPPLEAQEHFDVVVAKATNECDNVLECIDVQPTTLQAQIVGMAILCLAIVFLIIYS